MAVSTRGGRKLWLCTLLGGVSACTSSNTYSVDVGQLSSANVYLWFAHQDSSVYDSVEIVFPNASPDQGCPVLADDVTVTLGGTQLTGTRGSYDGGSWFLGERKAPWCSFPEFYEDTPVSTAATIDLVISDRDNTARVTIVAPYASHTLTTPTTLVPGSTAQLVLSATTDMLASSGLLVSCAEVNSPSTDVIDAYDASSYPSEPTPNDVLLSYQAGVVSFPVPANAGGTGYSGPLLCNDNLVFSPAITDCTGFLGCSAQSGAPDFSPRI